MPPLHSTWNGDRLSKVSFCRDGDETLRPTPPKIYAPQMGVPQSDCNNGYANLATDLMAIVTAQRAISGEIEIRRLVEMLLIITMKHVGAERGLLFLVCGREHEIEAEATIDGSDVRVVFPTALATSPRFPESVLRYVMRMEERVVLDDASAENQFSDDDYICSGRLRSILCLPLVTQHELVGVLYLENNQAPRAFAPDRLAMLEIFALQAAASLRNARSYINLQAENSERRKVEEKAVQLHHMYGKVQLDAGAELTGGLMAALAHELTQPLGAILSNAQAARRFLAMRRPKLSEVRAAVDEIISDNSRAVEAIRNVRTLFQTGDNEMTSVDLSSVLPDIERIVGADARRRKISLRLKLPATLPLINGSRTQLIQALLNLVVNAFDSIPDDWSGSREVAISAERSEPARVAVVVRDSGKGIDAAIMPRLFQAFVTTKPGGMGMGLAIARTIIEKHGGQLWAEPNAERGTSMKFYLPAEN